MQKNMEEVIMSKKVKQKMSNRKFLAIMLPIIALLLVIALAANIALGMFYDTIEMWFNGSGANFGSESAEAAKEVAKQVSLTIQGEGNVLLENNGVLPLDTEKTKKLAVFGWDSYGCIYGGTGSGSASTAEAITLYDALESAGFALYEDLKTVYANYKSERQAGLAVGSTDFTVYETPMADYGDSVLEGAKAFTDTALVVFGRVGGEGNDLPADYLELSKEEKELLDYVTANFENVIVLLNTANAMELGFLKEYDNIDAAMWIGFPGLVGMTAVAQCLTGEVNPSGRLNDIYVYDLTKDPTYHNVSTWGVKEYTDQSGRYYIDYSEGIYYGYRYYETAAADGLIDYDKAVVYPFGYGLSYTTFEKSIKSFDVSGNTVTVKVSVENTGDVAGKDVVQIYFTAPYDAAKGIEKAHVELVGFGKTAELKPGESETVTVEFSVDDMASYDEKGEGCYVLSAGDYEIKLMNNSHDVLDSRTYTVDSKIVYNEANGGRESDKTVAVNRFAYADGSDETVPVYYMSRATGLVLPTELEARSASQAVIDSLNATYKQDATLSPITTGVNANLKLQDMVGLDYDDPLWETFLNQLTFDEMAELIAYGGYSTIEIDSIGKVGTIDLDGPNGFNESNTTTGGDGGVAYPCEVVIASTWNEELAELWGEALGNEAENYGVSGWYAPGVNIHRSAFGGRNFEYFSEDPLLSGKMAAKTVYGASKYGLNCYVKHFAVNEVETHRDSNGLYSFVTEQAMREIYLVPFELAVKEGGTSAIMSSFTRLGTVWAGGSYELLTEVLREEWGFEGMVLTDYYMVFYSYMDVYQGLVAGNDIWLAGIRAFGTVPENRDVTIENNARRATKNILYAVANSNAYNATNVIDENDGINWMIYVYLVYTVLIGGAVVLTAVCVVRYVKHKKYIIAIIEQSPKTLSEE